MGGFSLPKIMLLISELLVLENVINLKLYFVLKLIYFCVHIKIDLI